MAHVSTGGIEEIVIWNSGTKEEISMDSGKKRGVIIQTSILTRERIAPRREIVLGDWTSFTYFGLIEGYDHTFLGLVIFGLRVGLFYFPAP
jgi:hypothetical protein